jgi:hypothetical protein
MDLRWSLSLMLAGAVINAVPSRAALHPTPRSPGFVEADIAGSGGERARGKRNQKNGREDDARGAQEWREMAARCRSYARWLDPEHRETLLQLADEYDQRARRAEERDRNA